MDKLKAALPYIIGVLLIMGLSTLLPTHQPVISVPAEPVFHIGPITITNAMFTSWVCVLIVVGLFYWGLKDMKLQPTGLQNILEFVYEGIYALTENVAGPKWAPQFFGVPATIFIFVFVVNIFGLFPGLPLHGVGVCEPLHYEEEMVEEEETDLELSAEEEHGEAEAEDDAHGEAEAEDDAYAEEADAHGAAVDDHGAGEDYEWWNTCGPGEHIVPLFRPPSTDLNFTLALALITQVLAQYFGIMALGLAGYMGKFFIIGKMKNAESPADFAMGAIDFLVGLLEFLSEFVKVIAYTFRLYGNIFAGEVTIFILTFFVPLILAIPMIGFEIFVAFIQAFVFFILSVAFYTLAVQSHGGEEGH